jgi:hypothetical protein
MCRTDLDEWHCNAHSNNLVVLSEGLFAPDNVRSQSLLSYLDLDMAFTEDSYIDSPTRAVGVTKAAFDHLLWREHVNLMEVLAGSDSSSGVPMAAMSLTAQQSDVVKMIKTGLYDTLILGYLRGYTGDTRFAIASHDPELHHVAHCVMQLAILVMAEHVA